MPTRPASRRAATPPSQQPRRPWNLRRIAAVVTALLLGAAAAVAGAAPANAEPSATMGAARPEYAYFAWNEPGTGTFHDFWAYLFPFDVVDDAGAKTTVQVYCADRMVEIDYSGAHPYAQSAWAERDGTGFGAHAAEVLWVLEHGYPTLTGAEVLADAGITTATDQSPDEVALAATQIAIWNLTNPEVAGARFPSPESIPVAGNAGHATLADSTAILTIVRQLLASAAHDGQEPAPALRIVPPVDGTPRSGLVGPFVVRTSASSVGVQSPSGAVVDASGAPVADAVDGDELYVRVDGVAVGERVSLDATASDARARTGTLWMPADGTRFQTLVTATDTVGYTAGDRAEVTLEQGVTPPTDEPGTPTDEPGTPSDEPGPGSEGPGDAATPDRAPSPSAELDGSVAAGGILAHTGVELGLAGGISGALILTGVLLVRRRRHRAQG